MLKAYIIENNGEDAIYYTDKPNRTISLENCIQKVFTNEKAPLRINLEKIIELRNTSTHYITEEYELTLSVRLTALEETVIRAKYTKQVAERLITITDELEQLIEAYNSNFAIRLEHFYYSTKDRAEATEYYHIEKEAKEGIRIVKELKNPNFTHKYNAKKCIKELNQKLKRENVHLIFNGNEVQLNQYHFQNMITYFGLKKNEKMCFEYHISANPQYSYSQQAIDFLYGELKKAPDHILNDIKMKIKKSTPGAKDSKR